MNKEIAIFDLDNTLTEGYSQKLFISFLFKKGLFPWYLYSELLIWFSLYKLGILKNPDRIMRKAFKLFRGHSFSEVQGIVEMFFNDVMRTSFYPEAEKLVHDHLQKKRLVILATSVLGPIAERAGKFLKISHVISTKLEIVEDVYTGEVVGDVIYGHNKYLALNNFFKENNLQDYSTWAYSDHISDLEVLENADFSIAVNPDPKLFDIAKERGWQIINFNKTA